MSVVAVAACRLKRQHLAKRRDACLGFDGNDLLNDFEPMGLKEDRNNNNDNSNKKKNPSRFVTEESLLRESRVCSGVYLGVIKIA